MLRSNGHLAVAGLIALLAACSRSTPMEMDMDMSAAIITQFFADLGPAKCARFASCCDSDEQQRLQRYIPTLASTEECEADFGRSYVRTIEETIIAVGHRTIRIDTAAMEECLESVRSCGSVAICKQALAGTISEKETCSYDMECRRGKCITTPQIQGMWCSYGEPGSHCWLSGDCVAEGYYCGPGRLCAPQREGYAPCETDDQCLSWDCTREPEEVDFYCADKLPPRVLSIDNCDGV